MLKRFLLAFLAPALLIALPVLLQPEKDAADEVSGDYDTLVVVSPHTAQIQYEFERGFRKYYKEKTGRNVKIDWRNVGGTSDITRYIEDSYTASFRQAWEKAGRTCTEAESLGGKQTVVSCEIITEALGVFVGFIKTFTHKNLLGVKPCIFHTVFRTILFQTFRLGSQNLYQRKC